MKIIEIKPIDQIHIQIFGKKIERIRDIVCDYYGATPAQVFAVDRHVGFRKPRQIIYTLCRDLLGTACPYHIIALCCNPDNPQDHATTRNGYTEITNQLKAKTAMGRVVDSDLRNEYQKIRGTAIYELSKMNGETDLYARYDKTTSVTLGNVTLKRVDAHCHSTGISRSMFIRTAVLDALNNIQNGTRI